MNEPNFSADQERHIRVLSEITTRQYFDVYLRDVFPQQIEQAITAHDQSRDSHNQIAAKFDRLVWLMIGVSGACGTGVGLALQRVLPILG